MAKCWKLAQVLGLTFFFMNMPKKVAAIEPEPHMRELSLPRAQKAEVPIDVILANSEEIPFPDDFLIL